MINKELLDAVRQVVREELAESKKPYVDPRKTENDRIFRDISRKQRAEQEQRTKDAQSACPHIAGCNALGEYPDLAGRTCIVWHQLYPEALHTGICSNCQRVFRPDDADYSRWRGRPSLNKDSGSQRVLVNAKQPDEFVEDTRCFSDFDETFSFQTINDDSQNPHLWSADKLNEQIEIQKKAYR